MKPKPKTESTETEPKQSPCRGPNGETLVWKPEKKRACKQEIIKRGGRKGERRGGERYHIANINTNN